jgi:hypothetical protein
LCRAISAIARSMMVVVTGSSSGNAAKPKNPETPPLIPASTEAARCAGGAFDCGSIEEMATLRQLRIAVSTALLMPFLAVLGIQRSTRSIGLPA